MAYDDQRGRTVLFGGENAAGAQIGDTWEWNGSSWTQMAVTGPAPREHHALAYDSQRGRTVLYGGQAPSAANPRETWEWDGTNWLLMASTTIGPSEQGNSMAYDSWRGCVVLLTPTSDTWSWNGATWMQIPVAGPVTSGKIVFDSRRGRTVLHGHPFGQTWEFDGANWMQMPVPGPVGRVLGAMVFDSQRGKSVLYAGYTTALIHGDTWEWDGTSWTQFTPVPPARAAHAMAYDSHRGRSVTFGGYYFTSSNGSTVDPGSFVIRGDTWEWAGTPGTAMPFGNGCGSPALLLSPAGPSALPTIGSTGQALLTCVPSPLTFMALGWSRSAVGPFALPFSLVAYGMPGCFLLQSAEVAAQPVVVGTVGSASYSLSLPNWSGLIGMHLYLQGWANAPGANAGNTIVSNAIDWTIGF